MNEHVFLETGFVNNKTFEYLKDVSFLFFGLGYLIALRIFQGL